MYFLLCLLLVPSGLKAQDDELDEWEDEDQDKGFSIALNLGAYQASKKSGNLYNGSCLFDISDDPNGVRCYSIMDRLTLNINDINYITNFYNIQSFEGPIDMHPTNMRYQASFLVGVNLMYNFNWANALTVDFNLMRIKAVDQFTLRFIGGEIQQNAQQDIRLFTITGNEERFSLNAGYRTRFEINKGANWYLDLGGSMLGASLERNTVRVAERDYQLILGANNPQQLIQYQPRTEIGFGFFGGVGVEFLFDEKYRMDIGFILNRDKLVLHTYEDNVWNMALVARFGL